MSIWEIFAGMGMFIDDSLAIVSVIGSGIMLVGSLAGLRRMSQFAEWSLLGLFLGAIGQISLLVTGMMPEKIGFFQMSPNVVNGLLFISLLMIIGRFVLPKRRRN